MKHEKRIQSTPTKVYRNAINFLFLLQEVSYQETQFLIKFLSLVKLHLNSIFKPFYINYMECDSDILSSYVYICLQHNLHVLILLLCLTMPVPCQSHINCKKLEGQLIAILIIAKYSVLLLALILLDLSDVNISSYHIFLFEMSLVSVILYSASSC